MTLSFTGERFIPGTRGEIWIEHWHRYHFAARWAKGKRVLDIACGEGYGSALLARHAAQVTGVDVSQDAVDHAKRAYAGLGNARFLKGSCTAIPVADGSVDVAISFETLEHIHEQEEFLAELDRVLAPGGVLLISCPNKAEYTDKRHTENEFHVKELYRPELDALVRKRFAHAAWYGQKPSFYSVIAPEAGGAAGELLEVAEQSPDRAQAQLAAPLYYILVAGRDRAAVDVVAPTVSVFADAGDWAYNDWFKVMRESEAAHKRIRELELANVTRRGWPEWLARPLMRLGLLK
jgi:ubiquinone/menaquinone biosynthesis C-methylase UbiE